MNRPRWFSLLEPAGAVPAQVALVLPLAATACAVLAGWLPAPVLAGAVSVRAFLLLSIASASVGVVSGIGGRAWPRLLLSLAVLAGLAWGAWGVRTHFVGRLDLGVGEGSAAYRDVEAGPSAGPPPLALEVAGVRGAPLPVCELRLAGHPITLTVGGRASDGGARIVLEAVHPAPRFFLEEPDGSRSVEGFLNVGGGTSSAQAFQFGVLPHRFYLREVTEGEGAGTIPPERLHLTVARGKLTLVDRAVKAGERVPVDGFTAAFEPGTGWVTLRVGRRAPLWPAAAVSVLLALAVVLGMSARRRASCPS